MTEVRYVGANDVEENYRTVKHGDVVDVDDPDRVRAMVEAGLWELADSKARLPKAAAKSEPEQGG